MPGAEYFLKVSFALAKEASWAPAGFVLAWDQFKMPYQVPAWGEASPETFPEVKLAESEDAFTISNKNFKAVIGKKNGALEDTTIQRKKTDRGSAGPEFLEAAHG